LNGIEPTHICGRRELYEEVNIVAEELEFVTYVDHGNKYCCLTLYNFPKPLTQDTAASIKAGVFRPLCDEAGLTAVDVEPQIGE